MDSDNHFTKLFTRLSSEDAFSDIATIVFIVVALMLIAYYMFDIFSDKNMQSLQTQMTQQKNNNNTDIEMDIPTYEEHDMNNYMTEQDNSMAEADDSISEVDNYMTGQDESMTEVDNSMTEVDNSMAEVYNSTEEVDNSTEEVDNSTEEVDNKITNAATKRVYKKLEDVVLPSISSKDGYISPYVVCYRGKSGDRSFTQKRSGCLACQVDLRKNGNKDYDGTKTNISAVCPYTHYDVTGVLTKNDCVTKCKKIQDLTDE